MQIAKYQIKDNIWEGIFIVIKLKYFCKSHNKLSCSACIAKIKGKGDGLHKDNDICLIEDIRVEKKNKLNENIKSLEDLSNDLEDSINEIKKLYERINENKEEIKLVIFRIALLISFALFHHQ